MILPPLPSAAVSWREERDGTLTLRCHHRGRPFDVARVSTTSAHRLHQAQANGTAVPIITPAGERVFWCRGLVFADHHGLSPEEAEGILGARHRQREIERTRALALVNSKNIPPSRYIDAATRAYVFERDQGRCQVCGSTTALEYDHCIPASLGGSNGYGNIRLLCLNCNRSTGARMAL